MSRTVETLVEALEQDKLNWLTMGPLVDYGFLDLSEVPVAFEGAMVQPYSLLFKAYRRIYEVKKAEGSMQAWKTALHDACIHGTLDVYLTEWFLANDPQNAAWRTFKANSFKVRNPYPLGSADDSSDEEDYVHEEDSDFDDDCDCCRD